MSDFNLNDIHSEEQFLIWLIAHMADTFGPRAVLRGGMMLRLLDSPRATHDLDYILTAFHSKNELKTPIVESFQKYPMIAVGKPSKHSTNIRFDVKLVNDHGSFHVLLEASVADKCPTVVISTGELAKKYRLEPRLIPMMRYDVALSNKLAAWAERQLVRDLYDAYYFYRFVGVRPDVNTLTARLKRLNYADKRLRQSEPTHLSLREFCAWLIRGATRLNDKAVTAGLASMSPDILPGLSLKIRVAVLELADWLMDQR